MYSDSDSDDLYLGSYTELANDQHTNNSDERVPSRAYTYFSESDEEEHCKYQDKLDLQREEEIAFLHDHYFEYLDRLYNADSFEENDDPYPIRAQNNVLEAARQCFRKESSERVISNFVSAANEELQRNKELLVSAAVDAIVHIGINHVCSMVLMPDAELRRTGPGTSVFHGYAIVVDNTAPAKKVIGGISNMNANIAMIPIDIGKNIHKSGMNMDEFIVDRMRKISKDRALFEDLSEFSPIERNEFYDQNVHVLNSEKGKFASSSTIHKMLKDKQGASVSEMQLTVGPINASIGVVMHRSRETRENEFFLYVNNYDARTSDSFQRFARYERSLENDTSASVGNSQYISIETLYKSDVHRRSKESSTALNEILLYRIASAFGCSPVAYKTMYNGRAMDATHATYLCPYNFLCPIRIPSVSDAWKSTTMYAVYVGCFPTNHIRGGVLYGLGRTCGFDLITPLSKHVIMDVSDKKSSWEIEATCNAFPMGASCLVNVTDISTKFAPTPREAKWNETHVFNRMRVHPYQLALDTYVNPSHKSMLAVKELEIRNSIIGRMSHVTINNLETCAVYCTGYNPVTLDKNEVLCYAGESDSNYVRVCAFNKELIDAITTRLMFVISNIGSSARSDVWIPDLSRILRQDTRRNDFLVHRDFFNWLFHNGKLPLDLGYGPLQIE